MTGDPDDGQTLASATPVDADEFYLLYQGVLAADDPDAFYRDAVLVLGIGRLGLAPDTLVHLHEGWIDYRSGTVAVPEHDPCTCERCVQRLQAEADVEDPNRLGTLCPGRYWRPATDRGARSVPFAWSRRLTCVLMEAFERFEYLDLEDPRGRLAAIADRAPGLDPDALSVASLRAGAATTFAALGLTADRLRDVLGADSTAGVERFVRRSERFGAGEPLVPDRGFRATYRVVGNPEPFAEEFHAPTDYGPDRRGRRARRAGTSSSPATNPRPTADAVEPDLLSESETVEFLDVDSDLVSVGRGSIESFAHAWVRRHDSREDDGDAAVRVWSSDRPSSRPVSPSDGASDPADRAADGGRSTGGPASAGGSTPQDRRPASADGPDGPTSPQRPDDPEHDANSRPDPAGTDRPGDRPDERRPAEEGGSPAVDGPGSDDAPESEGPDRGVGLVEASPSSAIGSPVCSYSVRYVSPRLTGPEPATGTIALDPEGLVLDVRGARASGNAFVAELGSVVDFSFEYEPDVGPAFPGGVGLAVDWDGQRETVGLAFEDDATEFAGDLLTTAFEGADAVVTDPVRRGGRVNRDATARRARLAFDGQRLVAAPVGGDLGDDPAAEIDLTRVSDVESTTQQYEGSAVPSVEITFAVGRAARTARIGFRNRRLARLFSRLCRTHYYRQRQRLGRLSLDHNEKEFLVTVHSMAEDGPDDVDVGQLLDLNDGDFTTLVSQLKRKDLIEMSDSGTKLTGLGRTVVNEKTDDVNF